MSYKKQIVTIMTLVVLLLLTMSTTIQAASVGRVYNLKSEMNGTKMVLTWDSVSGAAGYNVYVNNTRIGAVNTNQATLIGFSENTTYYLKVAAYNYQGREGSASSEVRFTTNVSETLSRVTNLEVTQTNGYVTLNWSPVNRATKYQIFVDVPNFGAVNIGEVNTTNVMMRNFKDGVRYGFSIRACQELVNGNVNYSEKSPMKYYTIDFDKDDNPPINDDNNNNNNVNVGTVTGVYVYNVGKYTANVSWDRNYNADGYEVEISKNYGSFKTIKTATSQSDTYAYISNLDANTTYQVRVIAYKWVNGTKKYGSYSYNSRFVTEKEPVQESDIVGKQVSNLSVKNVTKYTADISWSRLDVADGYEVELSKNYGTFKTVNTTSNTYTYLSNLDSNTTYQVRVIPYKWINGTKKYGSYSYSNRFDTERNYVEESIISDKQVRYVTESNVTSSTATISWAKLDGADGYEVKLSKNNGSFKTVKTSTSGNDTYAYLSNLDADSAYTVRVIAYKWVNGTKVYSKESAGRGFRTSRSTSSGSGSSGSTSYDVGTPTHLYVEVKNRNEAYLSWWAADNADGYEVWISENGGSFRFIDDGLDNSTILMSSSLEYNTNYKVKVKAYRYNSNRDKIYSPYFSETKSFKTEKYDRKYNSPNVGTINSIKPEVEKTTLYLSWASVSGADGYEIDFGVPGIGNTILTSNTNYKRIEGITDKKYNYTARIRAYKMINGVREYGAYSHQVKFKAE